MKEFNILMKLMEVCVVRRVLKKLEVDSNLIAGVGIDLKTGYYL